MSKGQEARKTEMDSRLRASLKTEEGAVADKFARAEMAFAPVKDVRSSDHAAHAAPKQPKVIRDTFSMPTGDYALINMLRQRCLSYGISATKSGIVRAGLHALNAMTSSELKAVLGELEQVKPGRPS